MIKEINTHVTIGIREHARDAYVVRQDGRILIHIGDVMVYCHDAKHAAAYFANLAVDVADAAEAEEDCEVTIRRHQAERKAAEAKTFQEVMALKYEGA